MGRSTLVLAGFVLLCVVCVQVHAICCPRDVFSLVCEDCTTTGVFGCCATGSCNTACCNCAGRCRAGRCRRRRRDVSWENHDEDVDVSSAHVARILTLGDANKDGRFSVEEAEVYFNNTGRSQSRLKRDLELMDINNDRYITAEEIDPPA